MVHKKGYYQRVGDTNYMLVAKRCSFMVLIFLHFVDIPHYFKCNKSCEFMLSVIGIIFLGIHMLGFSLFIVLLLNQIVIICLPRKL